MDEIPTRKRNQKGVETFQNCGGLCTICGLNRVKKTKYNHYIENDSTDNIYMVFAQEKHAKARDATEARERLIRERNIARTCATAAEGAAFSWPGRAQRRKTQGFLGVSQNARTVRPTICNRKKRAGLHAKGGQRKQGGAFMRGKNKKNMVKNADNRRAFPCAVMYIYSL